MAFFNKKEKKEKRKGENLVGKIIYCFILFAPLMSILVRSLYVTFNKNAYLSYSQEQSLNYRLIDNQTTLQDDVQYQFQPNRDIYNATNLQYINVKQIAITTTNILPNNIYRFRVYYNANNSTYALQFDGDTSGYINYGNFNTPSSLFFSFIADGEQSNTNYLSNIYKYEYSKQQSLDNAFDYGAKAVENSDLYNWAKNTATYTVMQATTQSLGITNTFIPMLLSYWLLISIIYFIYDIALILIWALHRRIHELGDSI